MPADSTQQQLEGHEERLQRAESGLSAVAITVGKIETGQETLTQVVRDGFGELKTTHEKLFARLDSHAGTLDNHDDRLKPVEAKLQEIERERTGRRKTAKNVALALLITGLGVAVTKAVEALLAWGQ